jgi:hypothetical protein
MVTKVHGYGNKNSPRQREVNKGKHNKGNNKGNGDTREEVQRRHGDKGKEKTGVVTPAPLPSLICAIRSNIC